MVKESERKIKYHLKWGKRLPKPDHVDMAQEEWDNLTARKRYELRYPDRLYLQRSKQWKKAFVSPYIARKDYNEMLEYQNGVCAICKNPETAIQRKFLYEGEPPIEVIKRLSIDHDHITDEIRGLLCGKCNAMLGLARDDIEILFAAIEYLLSSKEGD